MNPEFCELNGKAGAAGGTVAVGVPVPVYNEKSRVIEKKSDEPERETWDKKIDFLLSVIGFAVDLGNVWRFPYICYRNGGGAFLIPYFTMLAVGGFPLFYMELALGQYQRCGCLTVWRRICPMLKGIGFAICIIATYVSWYYNTIIAWALYYMFASMRSEVPWKHCNYTWNTDNCLEYKDPLRQEHSKSNLTAMGYTTPNEEFFEREVLGLRKDYNIDNLGPVKWELALCLFGVFTLVYFAMWKGVKSSGKAVWITATMPYVVLTILLIRGLTLPGAWKGVKYFIIPKFDKLLELSVWTDAAAQIFFSLGPGFGVLLALSSYNKFSNNCYRYLSSFRGGKPKCPPEVERLIKDALLTSAINCGTSLLAGFAVFSVLGYMAHQQGTEVEEVAREDVGLIFIAYPEALANLDVAPLWSVIFFFMLITLGLDTTFGGLEAIATGILDEWPQLRKRRELFILVLMVYCFLGSLATTTCGGIYLVQLMDTYGAPIAILFIVFIEAVAIAWIYGADRFTRDIEAMIGSMPRIYWQICTLVWKFISPLFLITLFLLSLIFAPQPQYGNYIYPTWSIVVGWLMVTSSIICVPAYIVYKFSITPGTTLERIRTIMTPEEVPTHVMTEPICL